MEIKLTDYLIEQLSDQQKLIYHLLQLGHKRQEILAKLNISVDTYKVQVKRIKEKQKGGTKSPKSPRVNYVLKQQIIKLHKRGYSKTKIARNLGLTLEQVKNTLNRHINEQQVRGLISVRKELGISITDLAKEANMDHQTIVDIEKGKLLPAKNIYSKIAKILLVKYKEFPPSPAEELSMLIQDKSLMAAVKYEYGGGSEEISLDDAQHIKLQLAINGIGNQKNLFKQRAQRIQVMAVSGKYNGRVAVRMSSKQRAQAGIVINYHRLRPLKIEEEHAATYLMNAIQLADIKQEIAF